MTEQLLSIRNINTFYGLIPMLIEVSLDVMKNQVCCVLGANGAGKSTLVKAILNIVSAASGEMVFLGRAIDGWPTNKRIAAGIQVASSATGTFPKMTVETNLKLGAYNIDDSKLLAARLEEVFNSFPVLKSRLQQKAGTLSGGERTMLAIARAVINKPYLLIMDEPSLGLAPIMVDEVFNVIRRLHREENMSILLVEQNANMALSVSEYCYMIQKGRIVKGGEAGEFQDEAIM